MSCNNFWIVESINAIFEAYGKRPTDIQIRIWSTLMKSYDERTVKQCIVTAVTRFNFVPSVKEFSDLLSEKKKLENCNICSNGIVKILNYQNEKTVINFFSCDCDLGINHQKDFERINLNQKKHLEITGG